MGEKVDEAKGRTKKAVGEATDNKSLKDRGRIDKASAKTKKAVGGAADKAKKAHRKVTS
jgi:uncharacterized protein YjbJ (UPF0337 family)